jgi:hypothetical protein
LYVWQIRATVKVQFKNVFWIWRWVAIRGSARFGFRAKHMISDNDEEKKEPETQTAQPEAETKPEESK